MNGIDIATRIVADYLTTPAGQATAQAAINKVLGAAVDSALGYGSEFRKQVDAAMAKALQLTSDIEIASYNDAILKVVERQLEGATTDAIERQVAGRMKELLAPVPAEIKLSELVRQYKEFVKDKMDSGCLCSGDSSITFVHDQKTEGYSKDFDYYGLDDEPGKQYRQCDIRFGVYKGSLFTLTFENAEVEKRLFVGPLYGFHRLLFQLKAANAKIVLDITPDDVDLDYGGHD